MSREIGIVYLHIGNSGVTFSVVDDGHGPTILVESSTFGNNTIEQRIHTDRKGIEALARLFERAAIHGQYSAEYCHAAGFSHGSPSFIFGDLEPKRGSGSQGCHVSEPGDDYADEEDEDCDDDGEDDNDDDCGEDGDGNDDCPDENDDELRTEQAISVSPPVKLNPDTNSYLGTPLETGDHSPYYDYQFVQSENHTFSLKDHVIEFILEHTPCLPGSLTGKLAINDIPFGTFTTLPDGEISFDGCYDSEFVPTRGWFSRTGLVSLYWESIPNDPELPLPKIDFSASYEYSFKN